MYQRTTSHTQLSITIHVHIPYTILTLLSSQESSVYTAFYNLYRGVGFHVPFRVASPLSRGAPRPARAELPRRKPTAAAAARRAAPAPPPAPAPVFPSANNTTM